MSACNICAYNVLQRFVFKHGDKEVKAQKTTKLYHAAGRGAECVPGTAYTYQVLAHPANSYAATEPLACCLLHHLLPPFVSVITRPSLEMAVHSLQDALHSSFCCCVLSHWHVPAAAAAVW